MRAVEVSAFGSPDVLRLVARPIPEPASGEILIRVQAAGVARADLLQRQGKYPPPPGVSDIPGLDVAGTIAALGGNVAGFRVGDSVCAILSGGGYAEYCVAPAEQVLPMPENWTQVETASLPENLFTAYDNIVTRAQLAKAENILIHGGSSGIGTMAIMLARLFGAQIIVTAGTDEKCDACLNLGAHFAINYRTTSHFAGEVQRLTDGHGVDVILDMVGGSYLSSNLTALATEGRLVIIATQGSGKAELDIPVLMKKRARIMGSMMRLRSPAEKGKVARALAKEIWPILPSKTVIRPVIDSVYPLSDASAAHTRLESNLSIGKVVLNVD